MHVFHDVVRTEVDALVELVQRRRKISFEEAAQELQLPQKTIESWATFLEEEGILGIEYKFTTPFLVMNTKDRAGKDDEYPYAKPDQRLSDLEKFLRQTQGELAKGEFAQAYKMLREAHAEMKSLFEDLKFERGEEKPFEDRRIQDLIAKIHNFLNHAMLLIEKNEYSKAREKLREIQAATHTVMNELKAMFFEMRKPDKDAGRSASEKSDILVSAEPETIIQEIYSQIEQGRFETAKKLYARLQEVYNKLPQGFMERKNLLKKDLVKLNRDMAVTFRKGYGERLKNAIGRIDELTNLVLKELKNRDFTTAVALIKKMNTIFEQLPEGYLEEKTKMRAEINLIEEKFLQMKESLAEEDIRSNTAKINESLSSFKRELAQGNLEAAEASYKAAKELFRSLPSGFLDREVEIQNTLLESYRALLLQKERQSKARVDKIIADISALIKHAANALDVKKDVDEAAKLYNEASKKCSELPSGFMPEKTRIETQILELNQKILSRTKEFFKDELQNKTLQINEMLKKADTYIRNNQIDLANELFLEISSIFNRLPIGFLYQKTELHNQILNVYKNILLSSDLKFINQHDTDTKKKYDTLCRMIVTFHRHLDLMETHLLKPNYDYVMKLYDELPHGIVSKNIKIRQEINKLSNIMKVQQLEARLDDPKTMAQVRILIEKVSKESPEAVKFINEIKQRLQRLQRKERDLQKTDQTDHNEHLDSLLEMLKNKDLDNALAKMADLTDSEQLTDYQRNRLSDFKTRLERIKEAFQRGDELISLKEEAKEHLRNQDFESAVNILEKLKKLKPSQDLDVLIKRVNNLKDNIIVVNR